MNINEIADNLKDMPFWSVLPLGTQVEGLPAALVKFPWGWQVMKHSSGVLDDKAAAKLIDERKRAAERGDWSA